MDTPLGSSMDFSTDYYTAVQRILSRVTTSTLQDFCRLQTNSERVDFCMRLDYIQDAFKMEANFPGKSASEAITLRDTGNIAYQSKLYQEALEFYTKSVLVAPYPQLKPSSPPPNDQPETEVEVEAKTKFKGEKYKGDELTLALANRSAALFQLKKYDLVISDIKLALELGYPKELQYKLYDRMGKSLMELDKHSDAITSFEKVKESLTFAKLDDKKRLQWCDGVDRLIQDCELRLDVNGDPCTVGLNKTSQLSLDTDVTLPKLKTSRNKRFTSCSSSLDVKFSTRIGRYAVARSPVQIGDVLMVEKPFVSVLSPECTNTHCYHCLKATQASIGCQQCTSVRYCSEECREHSWKVYHKCECKLLRVVQDAGVGQTAHLAWRLLLVVGRDRLVSLRKKLRTITREDSTENIQASRELPILVDKDGVYMAGFECLYTLLTHTPSRPRHELLQHTILSIFLLKVMVASGYFLENADNTKKNEVDDGELAYVGGMLLRFLQIISCNSMEIMQTHLGVNLQKAYQSTVGLALYPTAPLVNHSCNPCMELIYYGDILALRAIRSILEGEELTVDYGYVYYLTPKTQRQVSLRARYYFDCRCDACELNWPIKSRLPSGIPTVKCESCGGPLSQKTGQDKGAPPMSVKCRTCGHVQRPVDVMETLHKEAESLYKTLEDLKNGKSDNAAPVLENYLTMMEKYLMLPVKDYVTYLSTLKQCYRVQGNCLQNKNKK